MLSCLPGALSASFWHFLTLKASQAGPKHRKRNRRKRKKYFYRKKRKRKKILNSVNEKRKIKNREKKIKKKLKKFYKNNVKHFF
jgi:hypothetical protein